MNRNYMVELLKRMQEEDAKKSEECRKEHGAATICMECNQNTFVGIHPFWHRYARNLCDKCGPEYTRFLRVNGCLDA